MAKNKREHDLVRYSFKGPGWGRTSFTIYLDVKDVDGVRKCSTIKDDRLIAINRAYQTGSSSKEECKVQVKEIVKDLYKQDRRCHKRFHVHNAENWKVLEEYWEKVYSFRSLVCEVSTKNDLKRAVEALGQLSIYSASREEIQNAIDQKFKGNSQRRVIARLTQLLKFIGRDTLKLRKQMADFTQVSNLNESDFEKVLHFTPTEIEKSLLKLCYYSGLRIGEAYALEPQSLLPNGTIRVSGQIDRHGRRRHTKTRKPRLAYIFPAGLDAFKYWVNAAPSEKETINRLEASRDLMKKYCALAFPTDEKRHLTFHALRHCYAINLLTKGVSMSLLAQSLGNTLSVCQHYYVGYELTNESIEAINAIVSR